MHTLLYLGIDLVILRGCMPKLRLLRFAGNAEFFHDEAVRAVFEIRFGDHQSKCIDSHLLKLLFVFNLDQEAHFFNQLCIGAKLAEGGCLARHIRLQCSALLSLGLGGDKDASY